jgi:hypothetical protein
MKACWNDPVEEHVTADARSQGTVAVYHKASVEFTLNTWQQQLQQRQQQQAAHLVLPDFPAPTQRVAFVMVGQKAPET